MLTQCLQHLTFVTIKKLRISIKISQRKPRYYYLLHIEDILYYIYIIMKYKLVLFTINIS